MKNKIIFTIIVVVLFFSSFTGATTITNVIETGEQVDLEDLIDKNKLNRERINTPIITNEPRRKVLLFEKRLAHKDELINIIDCPLVSNELRGYHALHVGGIITAGYPNVELYTMHLQPNWMPVIDWCIENDIRVISMSVATSYTREREEALKKYTEWGGIVTAASGNWNYSSVSYPASSDYTIGVSATNSEDSNGDAVDITVDSYWSSKRYDYDDFITLSGTSGAQPVVVPFALRYQNENTTGTLESFRQWLYINSTTDLDHLAYTHSFGKLEKDERYFIYPDNLEDYSNLIKTFVEN